MIETGSNTRLRATLWAGVAAPVLVVSTFLVEGALRPGYDPVRHQVSLLSLGDAGSIQIASFLLGGALLILFSLGLRTRVRAGPGAVGAPLAIGGSGLGLVLAGLFSTVPSYGFPPGAPDGLPNALPASAYVHVVGAFLFFFCLVFASLILGRRFRRSGAMRWATFSIATGIVVFAFFGLSGGGPSGALLFPSAAGLFQRIAIITGLGWILAVALLELGGWVPARSDEG